MLNTLYYYFVLPFSALAGLAGIYYVLDPMATKRMLFGLTWNATKAYVTCHDWSTKIITFFEKEEDGYTSSESEDSGEVEIISQNIVLYDDDGKNQYIVNNSDGELEKLLECITPSIMFVTTKINETKYYKRTDDPLKSDTEYTTFTDKPFVQVEYVASKGAVPLDIHEQLTGFYINGNTILDATFLRWYLSCYYDKTLGDDYILHIFYKDVNLFTVGPEEGIKLNDNTYDKYKIKKVDAESEKEYEGAVD